MDDERQIKSYVWHGPKCFFVSTIERDSSAQVDPPPRFMETIAWEYDWDSGERGHSVAYAGSCPALSQHFEVCRQLYESGKYRIDDPGDSPALTAREVQVD